jgi:hypothetical protein
MADSMREKRKEKTCLGSFGKGEKVNKFAINEVHLCGS